MQHSTIKLTETQEVTMFQPITIADATEDTTTVSTSYGQIHVKVDDQTLAPFLPDHMGVNALGVYTVEQAKTLRDALSAAIADVEARTPGPDVYQLIDNDGYLWAFVPEVDRWACAMQLDDPDDPDDHFDVGGAKFSVYRGFESWAEVVETHGIQA